MIALLLSLASLLMFIFSQKHFHKSIVLFSIKSLQRGKTYYSPQTTLENSAQYQPDDSPLQHSNFLLFLLSLFPSTDRRFSPFVNSPPTHSSKRFPELLPKGLSFFFSDQFFFSHAPSLFSASIFLPFNPVKTMNYKVHHHRIMRIGFMASLYCISHNSL